MAHGIYEEEDLNLAAPGSILYRHDAQEGEIRLNARDRLRGGYVLPCALRRDPYYHTARRNDTLGRFLRDGALLIAKIERAENNFTLKTYFPKPRGNAIFLGMDKMKLKSV